MNFFEYTIELPVDETTETITNNIQNMITKGLCPFNLHKWTDDDYDDKKTRTIVITSLYNIHQIIYDLFKGVNAKYRCFYRTHVYM
jgi:hypothetical protein